MADSPFLIAGGGIAGLGASLGLARIGKSSCVLEKAPAFEEVGAGLQLGPNAVRALQWLGAWDAVASHCVSPAEIHVRDGLSGNILQRIPLGAGFENQFGAPYRVAHRADLLAGLLEAARSIPAITLQTNCEVADVSITETTLALKSGGTLKGEAIVGADGVHSLVRNLLSPQHSKRPAGHLLYRGLVPIGSLPPGANPDVVTLWLYPRGHVVHYAVSNWKQFNIVAAVEDVDAPLSAIFQKACNPLAEILAVQANWTAWPAFDLEAHRAWCENRTVLIGDAAHATLPYLAQGAAMALEDACMLSAAISGAAGLEAAFRGYSRERFARTAAIQRQSRRLGRIYHAGGFLRQARNAILQAATPRSFAARLAWIYDWKPEEK